MAVDKRDAREQVEIIMLMRHKAEAEFRLAALVASRFLREHGHLPDDTKEVFDEIKTRMQAITEAMRKLSKKIRDPFFGVETPTGWPPTGHEDA